MKNFFLGIVTMIILASLAFGAYYLGTQKQNTENQATIIPSPTINFVSQQPSETPPQEPSPTVKIENDAELIKAALFKKNNWPANDPINVSVSTNDGTYASGTAGGEGGGGYFFAKKVNGEWIIVADGNGVITCAELAPYPDYPKTLIPECYDEAKQDTVKR